MYCIQMLLTSHVHCCNFGHVESGGTFGLVKAEFVAGANEHDWHCQSNPTRPSPLHIVVVFVMVANGVGVVVVDVFLRCLQLYIYVIIYLFRPLQLLHIPNSTAASEYGIGTPSVSTRLIWCGDYVILPSNARCQVGCSQPYHSVGSKRSHQLTRWTQHSDVGPSESYEQYFVTGSAET